MSNYAHVIWEGGRAEIGLISGCVVELTSGARAGFAYVCVCLYVAGETLER